MPFFTMWDTEGETLRPIGFHTYLSGRAQQRNSLVAFAGQATPLAATPGKIGSTVIVARRAPSPPIIGTAARQQPS